MTNSINTKAVSDMFSFISKAKGTIQSVNKEALLEIGRRLIDRSPVGDPATWHPPYWPKGYIPGHFINNWQVGIDKIPEGIIDAIDPSGSGSLERLSHLGRWTIGHTYYFVNNLPYAAILESGLHSPQVGPAGMVGLTTTEFPEIVSQAEVKVAKDKRWAFEGDK